MTHSFVAYNTTASVSEDDQRAVAHVLALLWAWAPERSVVDLLRISVLNSQQGTRPFAHPLTPDDVKKALAAMKAAHMVEERTSGSKVFFRLAASVRGLVYEEMLCQHSADDLRRALHQHVGLRQLIDTYAWDLGSTGDSAAVFRLELFSGTTETVLDSLRQRIAYYMEWNAVYSLACFDAFHAPSMERIEPSWRWKLATDGILSMLSGWNAEFRAFADWALEQSFTRKDDMSPKLLRALAQWLALGGDCARALTLINHLGGGQTDAVRAACAIVQGRWVEGSTAFARALRERMDETREKKNLFFPSLAWLYPLALFAQQTPQAIETARKFCIGESGKKKPQVYDAWGCWVHAASIRLGDQAADPSGFVFLSSMVRTNVELGTLWRLLLRTWLMAELPAPAHDDPERGYITEWVAETSKRLQACGLYWYEKQVHAAHALLMNTPERAPDVPFFSNIGADSWRNVLAALQALGDEGASAVTNATNKKGVDTQLWWSLGLGKQGQVLEVTPWERKHGVRGWGAFKAVTLGKLASKADLTPHDIKLARLIRNDPSDRRFFLLDRAAAVMALVGHPFVMLADGMGIPVDVVEGVPQIESMRAPSPQGERIVLRITPEPHTEKNAPELWRVVYDETLRKELEALRFISVLQDSPQRVRVIRLNPAQRRAAQLVSGKFSVPASAQADLQVALGALAGHFHVQSDEVAAAVRQVSCETQLHAELSPAGNGLMLRLVVAPLGVHGPRLMPAHGRARVMASINGENVGTERDLVAERTHLDAVLTALDFLDPPEPGSTACEWVVDEPDLALSMVERLPGLSAVAAIDWPRGKAVRVHVLEANKVRITVHTERDWFRVAGSASLDEGRVLTLEALLAAAASQSRFVALGEGEYLALSKALRDKLQALTAVVESDKAGLRAPQMATYWLNEALEGVVSECDAQFGQRLERLRSAQLKTVALPGGLNAELRGYQEDGFAWAMRLAHAGFGACLADDMGLGKTLQALAVLLARSTGGAALVVAPTSVCGNWMAEALRFAPSLNFILYAEGERDKLIETVGAGDVLVVSYNLVQLAGEAFATRSWHTLIADEAQAVKNALAKRSQALFDISADFRLALSGTPVENRLSELWSIMRFCNPGLLGTLTRFNERFATPIERNRDRDAQRMLRRLIAPFVLRRTKAQVLDDLPARTELVFSVEPDANEAAHYEALRRQAVRSAEEISAQEGVPTAQARIQILAQLTRLRRAACDPRLTTPDLGYVGAKVRAFAELAVELRANGHKTLVFSQFVDFLTLLRVPLDEAGIAYQYLDGSTPAAERTRRVAAFQAGEGDLFLISLKAGGFGLNLTAADYVVITDPWWNPAAEDQAMGRAHRIGQLRPVTVYRLVSKGTLEERIIALHHDKRALADGILADDGEASNLPSSAELIALMRGDT